MNESNSIDDAVADLRMRALAARRQIETLGLVRKATQGKLIAMERTAADVVDNWEVLLAAKTFLGEAEEDNVTMDDEDMARQRHDDGGDAANVQGGSANAATPTPHRPTLDGAQSGAAAATTTEKSPEPARPPTSSAVDDTAGLVAVQHTDAAQEQREEIAAVRNAVEAFHSIVPLRPALANPATDESTAPHADNAQTAPEAHVYDVTALPHAKLLIALPYAFWVLCAQRLGHDPETLAKQVAAFDVELRSLQEQLTLCDLIEQHERRSIEVVDGSDVSGGSSLTGWAAVSAKNNVIVTRLENTVPLSNDPATLAEERAAADTATGGEVLGIPVVSVQLRATSRNASQGKQQANPQEQGPTSAAAATGTSAHPNNNNNHSSSTQQQQRSGPNPSTSSSTSDSSGNPEQQLRAISLRLIERMRTMPTTDRKAFATLTEEIDKRVSRFLWQLHHVADTRRGPEWRQDASETAAVLTDESSATTDVTLQDLQALEADRLRLAQLAERQALELQANWDRERLMYEGFVVDDERPKEEASQAGVGSDPGPKDQPQTDDVASTAIDAAVWLQRQTYRHLVETEELRKIAVTERDEAREDLAACRAELKERIDAHHKEREEYEHQLAEMRKTLQAKDAAIRDAEAANARLEILIAQRALEATEAKFEAQQLRESNRQLHAALRDNNTQRNNESRSVALPRKPITPTRSSSSASASTNAAAASSSSAAGVGASSSAVAHTNEEEPRHQPPPAPQRSASSSSLNQGSSRQAAPSSPRSKNEGEEVQKSSSSQQQRSEGSPQQQQDTPSSSSPTKDAQRNSSKVASPAPLSSDAIDQQQQKDRRSPSSAASNRSPRTRNSPNASNGATTTSPPSQGDATLTPRRREELFRTWEARDGQAPA